MAAATSGHAPCAPPPPCLAATAASPSIAAAAAAGISGDGLAEIAWHTGTTCLTGTPRLAGAPGLAGTPSATPLLLLLASGLLLVKRHASGLSYCILPLILLASESFHLHTVAVVLFSFVVLKDTTNVIHGLDWQTRFLCSFAKHLHHQDTQVAHEEGHTKFLTLLRGRGPWRDCIPSSLYAKRGLRSY